MARVIFVYPNRESLPGRLGTMRGAWLCVAWLLAGGLAQAGESGLTEAPLAVPSGPRGATMFTQLSPEQTGIVTENRYADPRMWGDRYQELAYGEIGTGVAIGDYDNDGRPDLLVVSKTEGCRLFRNLGNWKFEDVTAKAGLGGAPGAAKKFQQSADNEDDRAAATEPWCQGATFADVNNDGLLDIYVCRFGVPNLLYINQGDGTFKEEAAARGLAVVDASGMAAFCDYDRDGWLDVYVQTNILDAARHPNGQRGHLFHNNGDGTFTEVTEHAGIYGETFSHSATWWDFDNDGWPDLYVANDYSAPDRLYHNNRDGTFTDVINQVVPHMPYYAMGSDIGDVNNDGLIDFFVADMATTSHEKDQRGMAYSRAKAQLLPANQNESPQYMHNALYLNTGMGRCLEAARLAGIAATDWTWSVRFEDLDNDGRLDLFVTNGMNREYHGADLLDRIMGLENPADARRLMRSSPKLVETHLAYRNLGDLRFEEVGAKWGLNQRGVSFGAAFGDLDGDGDLDIVYANYEGGVTVLRNDSDHGHRLIVALRGTQSNRFGVGATVRIESASGPQVRQLVLARGYLSNSEPILHFGLGEDPVVKQLTVTWPNGQTQGFTNLAVDKHYTITEPSTPFTPATPPAPLPTQFSNVSEAANFSFASTELERPENTRQPLLPVRFNRRGPSLAVGDLNGDGHEDAIISGTSGSPARVLLGGADRFTVAEVPAMASNTVENGPILLFSAQGTGATDILLTRSGANLPIGAPDYQPVLLFNDGHGSLQQAPEGTLPSLPISVGAVAAADFDRDGHLDVFLGARVLPGQYPLPPRSALLANRGGKFEDVTDQIAPGLRNVGLVSAALWSDVDGDGWPDLVLALEWGQVKYFHNDQGRGFTDWTDKAGFASAGTGWWTSLASADFNGDGRPD